MSNLDSGIGSVLKTNQENLLPATSQLDRIGYLTNSSCNRPYTGMSNNYSTGINTSYPTSSVIGRQCNSVEDNNEQNYYSRCGIQTTLPRIPRFLHYYS